MTATSKAPAKKTTAAPAKTAAKKTAPKKAAPKKTAAKKTSANGGNVKLGDRVFVPVVAAYNNGVSEAPATVTNVLDVKGESRVNVRVHMDSEHDVHVTNVLVVTRAGAKKAAADGQRVAFKTASS